MRIIGWILRLFLLGVATITIVSQVMRVFDIWTTLQVVLSGIALYLFLKMRNVSKWGRIAGWVGLGIWCVMTYILVLEPALVAYHYDPKVPEWMNAATPFIAAFAPFIPLWAATYDPLWNHWQ